MEAVFCTDCLEDALRAHGKPEMFNSEGFTGVLKREGITISMNGHGRAFDNIFVERLWRSVKHEDVYLKGYATVGELLLGLTKYFSFYKLERPHQGLQNRTPGEVYQSACGGGAMILDKYGAVKRIPIPLRSTGTALVEVELKNSGIQEEENRGSAVQLRGYQVQLKLSSNSS